MLLGVVSFAPVVAAGQPRARQGATPTRPPLARPALGPDRAALRAQGQAIFDDWIAASGRATDSVWQARLDSMMRRLSTATGIQRLELAYAIVNDADVNAAALPGGFIVVNRGMLNFVDSLSARDTSNSDRAGRATGMLASVLAHELAHVTLGHAEQPAPPSARSAVAGTRAGSSRASRGGMTGVPDELIARQRQLRADEDAADRTGALYLVRAGWPIEHAMDVMRALDRAERSRPIRRSALDDFSWLRSHPRAAARLAAIEGFRAALRAHQSDLDDALTLIANDAEPETAIALLDAVLVAFPDLAVARHARAVASQQQYFALIPVATLAVHPSTPVFASEFLLSVRGEATTAARLVSSAREDYQRAMAAETHPFTLSNLAILDAYAGDSARALARAARAFAAAPDDVDVLNNLGVVRYLARNVVGARQAFESAIRLHGDSAPPRVLFNYARTLLDIGDPEGARVMEEYLLRDGTSAWARLGRSLIGARTGGEAVAVAPAAGGDSVPPTVSGVALGAMPGDVVRAIGEPDKRETQRGQAIWRYHARGLALVITPRDGVRSIALESATAEALAGARVGDAMSTVRSAWGLPSEIQRDRLIYVRGTWSLVVERAFGLVSRLALMRP